MIPKNYFHKPITYSIFVFLVLLLIAFLFYGKFGSYIKLCCNEKVSCDNPLYVCNKNNSDLNIVDSINCKGYSKFNCEGLEICNTQKIEPDTCISNSNFITENLTLLYFIILLIGLLINHAYYKIKRGISK